MTLKKALKTQKKSKGKTDILEILNIDFKNNFLKNSYYRNKIKGLPVGKYFISDLDGTFFRGVLQKEAFSIFAQFIRKQDSTKLDIEAYYVFLKDYKHFHKLEQKAYNKEIEYFEYLNAGIYLLLKHKKLVKWSNYIAEVTRVFESRKKVTPYRFSISKMKEILLSGKKFLFISGAPEFIFEIYLHILKEHIGKILGKKYAGNIYGIGSHISIKNNKVIPLWGKEDKIRLINILKEKKIISKVIGGMGDTRSDFGISSTLEKNSNFYFVNPERKVLEEFEKLQYKGINYKIIIERKDLLCRIERENINILDIK